MHEDDEMQASIESSGSVNETKSELDSQPISVDQVRFYLFLHQIFNELALIVNLFYPQIRIMTYVWMFD